MTVNNKPNLKLFLEDALKDGETRVLKGYTLFHNFSLLNQMLALQQLAKPGPIKTYNQWKKIGRQVKKGSKAISLYMPVTVFKKDENGNKIDKEGEYLKKTFFMMKKGWFSLHDTTGEAFEEISVPKWDKELAHKTLGIKEVPFEVIEGNAQGYANIKDGIPVLALNPLAEFKHKTRFHEMAHHVLGHLKALSPSGEIDMDVKEVEAESVAFLCLASLGIKKGLPESRHYIRAWLGSNKLDQKNVSRIFSAVTKILKAGTPSS